MFETDLSILSQHYKFNLKPHKLVGVVSIVLGLVLGFVGVLFWLWQVNFQSQDLIDLDGVSERVIIASDSATLVVDVGGAVKHPGVYRVKFGQRVGDVIEKAGGFTKQADSYYLNKELNLAKRVFDGEKIYIPTKKELTLVVSDNQPNIKDKIKTNKLNQVPAGKVSINQADKSDLESLEGIGEVRAQKIIDNRPYTSIGELVTKKVIPESVLKANQALLVL